MKTLFNVDLFDNLLEIELEGVTIDLHNDYTCVSIKFIDNNLSISFNHDGSDEKIIIDFGDALINKFNLPVMNPKGLTLDNFHRGRYEVDGVLYDEYHERRCYYIEFYEDGEMELLCKSVMIGSVGSVSD